MPQEFDLDAAAEDLLAEEGEVVAQPPLKKQRVEKTRAAVKEASASTTVLPREDPSSSPTTEPRVSKGKTVVIPEGAEGAGVAAPGEFRPELYDGFLKRKLLDSDSLQKTPEIGPTLLSSLCLPIDTAKWAEDPDESIIRIMYHQAQAGQGLSVYHHEMIKVIGKKDAELERLKKRAGELERQRDSKKRECDRAVKEKREKTEEVTLLNARVKELEEELVREKAGVAAAETAAFERGRKEQFDVDKVKAAGMLGKGRLQGFTKGYEMALDSAGVAQDSPLRTVPPLPRFPASSARVEEPTEKVAEGDVAQAEGTPTEGAAVAGGGSTEA